MAISPPSDIVLDVATAADPSKVRAATARLAKLAADPTASNTEFSKALAVAHAGLKADVQTSAAIPSSLPMSGAPTISRAPAHAKDVYQKFEAVFLQNFVENILPKDDDLYGDKNSAGPYRSMMAEQLATQLAKAGGIGIAKAIEAKHGASGARSSLAAAAIADPAT